MKFLKKNPSDITTKNSNRYIKRALKVYSKTKKVNQAGTFRGTLGLKLLEPCRLEYKQLESIRRLFLPYTKAISRVWINGSFVTPLTKKSTGTRMGKGKGKLSKWVSTYTRGTIIIELEFFYQDLNFSNMLKRLKYKLPFRYAIITNYNVNV